MKKLLRNVTLFCAITAATPEAIASIDGGITLPAFGNVYAETGQEFGFHVNLTNKCDEPISEITYKVVATDAANSSSTLNGIDDSELPLKTLNLSENPIDAGKSLAVEFKAIAPDNNNEIQKIQVRIKSLNGEAYENKASGKVTALDFCPELRTCVEDYTGTWCGWCPRGYVAMEMINRDYHHKVLTIAYHSGDIMGTGKFTNPYSIEGYPTLTYNRSEVGGSVATYPELAKLGSRAMIAANGYATAAVNMKDAYWSDENHTNAVGVVEIEFPIDVTNGEYRLEFAIIEDGLRDPNNGENPRTASYWEQTNGYAGGGNPWEDPLWDLFVGQSSSRSGLEFNDVCLMNSLKTPNGLVASIPATEAHTKLTYTMTFPNVNNIVIGGTNLLMNPDKCRIACILSKGNNYVNCHWMNVANESAGINTVAADEAIDLDTPKEYYTISGQKVNSDRLTPGLYIVRQGNHASKVVIR